MESTENKTKQYQHDYYLKTRENRRMKVQCDICARSVCSEYMFKHKQKNICARNAKKKINEYVETE